ncbi:MAG TPA: multicopper oxidase domain-containing protein [Acidimicrobiales bacterium]
MSETITPTRPRPDPESDHGRAEDRPDGRPARPGGAASGDGEPPSRGRAGATPAAPAGEPGLSVGSFAVVVAVLALVFASVALVVGKGDGEGGGSGGSAGSGDATTVELSEFAITPADLSVPAGGSLEVTNSGSTPHNLSIEGTDIATTDLAAGESETLDLSSLEPGEYEVLCTIPGHADSGMTGTLTVTEGEARGAAAGSAASGGSGDSGDGAVSGHDHAAMTEEQYAEMSRMMNESVERFPAETEGEGNQVLEPEVQPDGTKLFELTAEVTPWEVEPGRTVDAWTYNGMVPGPQLHVDVGDRVSIRLQNNLPMGTDLHLHGINVPNSMDGVAPITQDLIEPGESFTYTFTADEPAVAMYHAHHHGQMQIPNGMLGTLFVGEVPLPRGETVSGHRIPGDLRVDHELPLVLNDSGVIGYSLNGKSFPATAPVTARRGDWMLVHYYNAGAQIHPMHLHQFDQIVVAKDGFPVDEPYVADTLNVAPGERYSVLVRLDEPGTWVWHCHILNHVERETGMFGMITAVVVE